VGFSLLDGVGVSRVERKSWGTARCQCPRWETEEMVLRDTLGSSSQLSEGKGNQGKAGKTEKRRAEPGSPQGGLLWTLEHSSGGSGPGLSMTFAP
jgi:hypothetical protein